MTEIYKNKIIKIVFKLFILKAIIVFYIDFNYY